MKEWAMDAVDAVMAALEQVRRPAWVPVEVREFTLHATRDLAPDSINGASRSLSALDGLCVWGLRQGYSLDLDVLLQPHLLERYARHLSREAKRGRGSQSVHNAHVGRLRSIAAQREQAKYNPQVRDRSVKHLPQTPYSAGELRDRLKAGRLLERPGAKRTYLSVLALGAGAGLMPNEMHAARVEDLRLDDGVLWIAPRSALRTVAEVPISKKWAPVLGEALALESSRDDNRILASGVQRSGLDDFLRTLAGRSPLLRVQLSRLRATWMLNRVEAGARVDEIMKFAGLTTAEPLRFLVPRAMSRDISAIRRIFG